MTHLIALANQKGGVGKTTTTVNLAAGIAHLGQRVLLIDLDPQGNATMGVGVDKHALSHTIGECLLGQATLEEAFIKTETKHLSLLPANTDLTAAEVGLLNLDARETVLKTLLVPVLEHYDFIFIDCPPSLNMLTLNALVAASSVIIPMQCEYYALEGLSGLIDTIANLQRSANPNLNVMGVVRTLFDGRNRLSLEVAEQLVSHFGEKLFETIIPRNIRLAEAPSYGQPIMDYDEKSTGALAYAALAEEVLARCTPAKSASEKASKRTVESRKKTPEPA